MSNSNGMTRAQWLQWSVASGIASIVMITTVLAFGRSVIYSKESGKILEKRVDRIENRIDDRLKTLDGKIDTLRELILLTRKPNKDEY
jgi:di/tricarboxylate transporter